MDLNSQEYEETLALARQEAGVSEDGLQLAYEPYWHVPGTKRGAGQKRYERQRAAEDPDFEKKHPRGKGEKGGQFIKKGDTGLAVQQVQQAIGIDPTGTYGKKTKKAIKEYQRANGLQVDGIVGAQTASSILGRENVQEPGALTAPLIQALESTGRLRRRIRAEAERKQGRERGRRNRT